MMAMALFATYQAFQRRLRRIVPDKHASANLHCAVVSNFAQSSPKSRRALRLGNRRASNYRHLITERLSVEIVGFSHPERKI